MDGALGKLAFVVLWALTMSAPVFGQPSLTAEHTEFVLRWPDGRSLRSFSIACTITMPLPLLGRS